jgi:phospholipid-binding lipoprotein MlaA
MNTNHAAYRLLLPSLCLVLLPLAALAQTQASPSPQAFNAPPPAVLTWGPSMELPDEVTVPAGGDASEGASRYGDPWERFNRRMHRFNMFIDRIALKPVAKGYQRITPAPVRTGVRNFFSNLGQPLTAVNLLLQGRPGQAGTALGRFTLNTTLGLAGFFDPATAANIPYRDADLGQTLGRYGWERSRYLVMPLFGPGTVRDVGARLVNTRVSPISWLADEYGPGVTFVYGVDARASALQFDGMLAEAEDDYLLIRDAYMQRRHCQIVDCSDDLPDYLLPEYQYEIPDVDIDTFRR